MDAEKRESRAIITTITNPVFYYKVVFCCGYKYDEIVEELKKQGCSDWLEAFESGGTGDLMDKGDGWYALYRPIHNKEKDKTVYYTFIVLENRFTYTDEEYSKLAHEVLHICMYILPDFFDIEREWESFAYNHTFIMDQCLEKLRGKEID